MFIIRSSSTIIITSIIVTIIITIISSNSGVAQSRTRGDRGSNNEKVYIYIYVYIVECHIILYV